MNPTIDVRQTEGLDWSALEVCLKNNIAHLKGPMTVRQFPSGNSNLTYALTFANRELVLRRPPFGTKPKAGHSMLREYRIMKALKPVYSAVPECLFYSDDLSVVGAEFYVMERVQGILLTKQIPQHWGHSAADNRRLCLAIFDKLIDLHKVDYQAAGLGDYGKPEGYVERQISGWNDRFQKAHTDDIPRFENVMQWLADKMPASESAHSIVHGDFRIDNVILNGDNHFEVAAVLDWEISALGDPLMDLANTLAYWTEATDSEQMRALRVQPSDAPGMLTRQELTQYYSEQTNLDVSHFDFYRVYGYWRNATILQQIYYRYATGQTDDPRFAAFKSAIIVWGNYCEALIDKSSL